LYQGLAEIGPEWTIGELMVTVKRQEIIEAFRREKEPLSKYDLAAILERNPDTIWKTLHRMGDAVKYTGRGLYTFIEPTGWTDMSARDVVRRLVEDDSSLEGGR